MDQGRNMRAEGIRLRYLYRDIVLRGKARITVDAARKLVGPDCAYHLYGRLERKRRRRRRSGARG